MTGEPVDVWDGQNVEALRSRWGVPLLEAYATIGSTNDRARTLTGLGAEPFTVVVADHQETGRGRRGDEWHSAAGRGLLLSIVLPPLGSTASLLVGLAAAQAIELVTPSLEVGLKWPNDLWVAGRKVGGVLCESTRHGLVAGVGINVGAGGLPSDLDGRATSLEGEAGTLPSRARLAGALVVAVRSRIAVDRAAGPDSGLDGEAHRELVRRDVLLGRSIATEAAGEGIARGIDESGALLLETADGNRRRVVAGSVRLR